MILLFCYEIHSKHFHLNLFSSNNFYSNFFFSADREKFKLPKNLDDAKDLGRVLSNYKDDFFLQVVLGFMVTYILYPFLSFTFMTMFW